jgi:hypothetical protein
VRYRVPSRLAHATLSTAHGEDGESDLRVYVRPLPGGPTLGLVGVGALIWSVATQRSSDVVAVISQMVDEPAEDIRADVESYLGDLVAEGLLELSESA